MYIKTERQRKIERDTEKEREIYRLKKEIESNKVRIIEREKDTKRIIKI